MDLILTVQRKEFDTTLDLIGKPVYYKGFGVLGNEQVQLDQYLLVTSMTKTAIEVVDHKKRAITLDISQVNAAAAFTLVVLGNDEDLVAPPTEGTEDPPSEEPEPEPEPPVEEPIEEEPEVVAPDTEEPVEEPEVVAPDTEEPVEEPTVPVEGEDVVAPPTEETEEEVVAPEVVEDEKP